MRPLDCLIVGGGPAGLTGALYLARFRLSVLVIDGARSRAALIPRSHNHAGFPDGISGVDLLDRMRDHATRYGAEIRQGQVARLATDGDGFVATLTGEDIRARSILLATGVANHRPEMSDELHAEALRRGRLRYCPVCDGYEVTDHNVAVVGVGARALKEAEFLRSYTANVTLVASEAEAGLTAAERARCDALGIRVVDGPARDYALEARALSVACAAGRLSFDTIYPALGSDVHSDLARSLGAALSEDGCIKVDAHQRTSVTGLYAAGDVVLGLDQISHAMGEAGVAATTIRNDLARRAPLLREDGSGEAAARRD